MRDAELRHDFAVQSVCADVASDGEGVPCEGLVVVEQLEVFEGELSRGGVGGGEKEASHLDLGSGVVEVDVLIF